LSTENSYKKIITKATTAENIEFTERDDKKVIMQVNKYVPHYLKIPQKLKTSELKIL